MKAVVGAGNGCHMCDVLASREIVNEVILWTSKRNRRRKALDIWQKAPINSYDKKPSA